MTAGPLAWADGHDPTRLVGKAVPGVATMISDGVVGGEHSIREPVVAQELPDVFDRVQLWLLGRQLGDGDVGGHDQPL